MGQCLLDFSSAAIDIYCPVLSLLPYRIKTYSVGLSVLNKMAISSFSKMVIDSSCSMYMSAEHPYQSGMPKMLAVLMNQYIVENFLHMEDVTSKFVLCLLFCWQNAVQNHLTILAGVRWQKKTSEP